MKVASLFGSLLLLCSFYAMSAVSAQSAQDLGVDRPQKIALAALRDHYRPVLIFAPTDDAVFIAQLEAFAKHSSDLHEREVVIIPILRRDSGKPWGITAPAGFFGVLSEAEQATARSRFRIAPDAFTVLLIGKDGGEKLRSTSPVSPQKLFDAIDAMPMRQDEMRARQHP